MTSWICSGLFRPIQIWVVEDGLSSRKRGSYDEIGGTGGESKDAGGGNRDLSGETGSSGGRTESSDGYTVDLVTETEVPYGGPGALIVEAGLE